VYAEKWTLLKKTNTHLHNIGIASMVWR